MLRRPGLPYPFRRRRDVEEAQRGAAFASALVGAFLTWPLVTAVAMIREASVTTDDFRWGRRPVVWSTDADCPFDTTLFAIAILILGVCGLWFIRAVQIIARSPESARKRALLMAPMLTILLVGALVVLF